MSTRAVDVKKALRDILTGMSVTVADDVQVTYGFPGRNIRREWATVGRVTWDDAQWATNRSRQESFSVAVIISVQIGGGTPEECETRAIQIAAEFEDALKANPSLSGLCVTTGYTPRELNSWPSDQTTYEAQYETSVRATCRP